MRSAAKPLVTSERLAADQTLEIKLTLTKNAVIYFEAKSSVLTPDRGFDYTRATTGM